MTRRERDEYYRHLRAERAKLTAAAVFVGICAVVGFFTIGTLLIEALCLAIGV